MPTKIAAAERPPQEVKTPPPGALTAVTLVPLEDIFPNPWQPRQDEDPEALRELAASIQAHGLIQPPIGRRRPDGKVELAAGHRRWEAYQLLNDQEQDRPGPWAAMPVQVRDLTDQQMADLALQENAKRRDLNPIELGKAYKKYLQDFPCTQQELAERQHIAQPTLANTLRLLELPAEVQGLIISRGITPAHGRELLSAAKYSDKITEMARDAAAQGWSVKALQNRIHFHVDSKLKSLDDWQAQQHKKAFAGCAVCPEMVEIAGIPYCTKPSCFDDKIKAAQRQEEEDIARKFKDTERVNIQKLGYGKYEWFNDDQLDNPAECVGCEHLKLGGYSSDENRQICISPTCYKKKQAARTRVLNKATRETYEALLGKAKDFFEANWPSLRGPALLLIDTLRDYPLNREIAPGLGIDPKGKNFEAELNERISTLEAKELWGLAIRLALFKRHHDDRYGSDNKNVARGVALLTGQGKVAETRGREVATHQAHNLEIVGSSPTPATN